MRLREVAERAPAEHDLAKVEEERRARARASLVRRHIGRLPCIPDVEVRVARRCVPVDRVAAREQPLVDRHRAHASRQREVDGRRIRREDVAPRRVAHARVRRDAAPTRPRSDARERVAMSGAGAVLGRDEHREHDGDVAHVALGTVRAGLERVDARHDDGTHADTLAAARRVLGRARAPAVVGYVDDQRDRPRRVRRCRVAVEKAVRVHGQRAGHGCASGSDGLKGCHF